MALRDLVRKTAGGVSGVDCACRLPRRPEFTSEAIAKSSTSSRVLSPTVNMVIKFAAEYGRCMLSTPCSAPALRMLCASLVSPASDPFLACTNVVEIPMTMNDQW